MTGVSLHIGLNYLDKEHYGSECRLPNCVNDAMAMQYIASQNGFENYIMVNEDATTHNLMEFLGQAAVGLEDGDILFLSFSGHGGLLQDVNGDEETGDMDQTFLMFDKIIVDDELYIQWSKFRPGVRVLVIADSCHSGTLVKDPILPFLSFKKDERYEQGLVYRTYRKHQREYDAVLKNISAIPKTSVDCSVLLLAACQDGEFAGAGRNLPDQLSTFTEAIIECWDNGKFEGNYKQFYKLLCRYVTEKNEGQYPNYYFTGKKHPFFEAQNPFIIK